MEYYFFLYNVSENDRSFKASKNYCNLDGFGLFNLIHTYINTYLALLSGFLVCCAFPKLLKKELSLQTASQKLFRNVGPNK